MSWGLHKCLVSKSCSSHYRHSEFRLHFSPRNNTLQKTVLKELTLLRRWQSPMHAFTHWLSENALSSSFTTTHTAMLIFHEGTSTECWKEYILCETPLLSSSTEIGTLIMYQCRWLLLKTLFPRHNLFPEWCRGDKLSTAVFSEWNAVVAPYGTFSLFLL